jgi:hypothetical protein
VTGEIRGRLLACWHVLRGDGIIRGVSVRQGYVTLHRSRTQASGGSEVIGNVLLTAGGRPARVEGSVIRLRAED